MKSNIILHRIFLPHFPIFHLIRKIQAENFSFANDPFSRYNIGMVRWHDDDSRIDYCCNNVKWKIKPGLNIALSGQEMLLYQFGLYYFLKVILVIEIIISRNSTTGKIWQLFKQNYILLKFEKRQVWMLKIIFVCVRPTTIADVMKKHSI